jgi:hypothetical protein
MEKKIYGHSSWFEGSCRDCGCKNHKGVEIFDMEDAPSWVEPIDR